MAKSDNVIKSLALPKAMVDRVESMGYAWSSFVRDAVAEKLDRIDAQTRREFTNLFDLTGQESGIVAFGETVIVCNWSSFGEMQLPIVTPWGSVIGYDYGYHMIKSAGETDDVYRFLPSGPDVAYDTNGDMPMLASNKTHGRWWRIGECVVIAPDGWN